MLKELKLANDLFPAMREGGKRMTCRLGRRDVPLGHFVFVSTDPVEGVDGIEYHEVGGEKFLYCPVVVQEVQYKRLLDVTDEEAQADGFDGVTAMLEGMRRFYPDIHIGCEVTLVRFRPQRIINA